MTDEVTIIRHDRGQDFQSLDPPIWEFVYKGAGVVTVIVAPFELYALRIAYSLAFWTSADVRELTVKVLGAYHQFIRRDDVPAS